MCRNRSSSERGQGIIEFAVIFPLFVLFVFIVIDIAIAMGRYSEVTNAAKEGARLGATGASGNAIVARVEDQSFGLLNGATASCPANDDGEVCVEWIDGPNNQAAGQVGTWVKVTARYEYGFVTPVGSIDGSFLGLNVVDVRDSIDITSCSVMRLERPNLNPPQIGTNPEC